MLNTTIRHFLRSFPALAGIVLVAASMGAAGCSGVQGTILGKAFPIGDEISGVTPTAGVIVLTSQPGICEAFTAGHGAKNEQEMVISLIVLGPFSENSPPTQPGTYRVAEGATLAGLVAQVSYADVGASAFCEAPGATGVGGTINLTAIDNGAYTGSADVTFNSGDHVTFDFSTTQCPAVGMSATCD